MNNCAIADLSPLGLIKISGLDAAKFLQGQLTCDVREVTDTQSRLGAHCDPKGRVQFTFRLFKYQEDYYLCLEKNMISQAISLLQKYAVFSKVSLQDVTAEWNYLGLCGLDCKNYLPHDLKIPNIDDEVCAIENFISIKLPGTLARVLMVGTPDIITNIYQQLTKEHINVDYQLWKLFDIQTGIASVSPKTIGEFTPHDINYPELNGVSFTKGCYTGQEIVARMQYLGKLKQHLVHVSFKTAITPLPGTRLLMENREVGRIVEVAQNNDTFEALAVLQDHARDKNIHLEETNTKVVVIK